MEEETSEWKNQFAIQLVEPTEGKKFEQETFVHQAK